METQVGPFLRARDRRYTPIGEHEGDPPPPTVRAVAIRLAIVNDYEVVVHGLASMLRSYSDRVEVVEVDVNAHPVSSVDIALFDTFAQSFRDRARIARLVSDPRIGKVVVYTWSADDPAVGQTRVPGISAYVSKRLAAADLVDTLERIHAGDPVRAPRLRARAAGRRRLAGSRGGAHGAGVRGAVADHAGLLQQRHRRHHDAVDQLDQVLHPLGVPEDRRHLAIAGDPLGHRPRLPARPGPVRRATSCPPTRA